MGHDAFFRLNLQGQISRYGSKTGRNSFCNNMTNLLDENLRYEKVEKMAAFFEN